MMQGHQQFYNVGNKNTERSFKLVPKGRIYENKKSKLSFRSSAKTFMTCFLVLFGRGVCVKWRWRQKCFSVHVKYLILVPLWQNGNGYKISQTWVWKQSIELFWNSFVRTDARTDGRTDSDFNRNCSETRKNLKSEIEDLVKIIRAFRWEAK